MDFVHVDKTASMVTAFPSMWVDASSVVIGHVAAPFLMVSALACTAAFADWDDPTIATFMSTSSELTIRFTLGFAGTCADTVAALGLFDKAYSSTLDFLAALPEELSRVPDPSPFEFKTTDMETPTPFLIGAVAGRAAVAGIAGVPAVRAAGGRARVAAIRAVPAIPAIAAVLGTGPPDLAWWNMLCLAHSLDRASPLPLASFLRRGMVALDRCSSLARADATSRICSANDILRAYLLAQLPAASSDASLARLFRRTHDRLHALPSPLRSGSLDPDVLELELADDLAWLTPEKQDGITAQRLIYIQPSYDAVYDLVIRLPDTAARVSVISQIVALALPKFVKQSLYAQLDPLQNFLSDRSSLLIQSWNKGLPVHEVVRVLLTDFVDGETGPQLADTTTGNDDGSLETGSSKVLGLSASALRRTLVEDADFLGAVEEIMQEDTSTADGRRGALEIAYLSGCVIFTRFFANPRLLVSWHKVFTSLYSCLGAAPSYFGRAQAADSSGVIDPLREEWEFHESQLALYHRGHVSSMMHFGLPHGSLALYNLSASEAFLDCPKDQLYVVESVLKLQAAFVGSTFTAAGWNPYSTEGYTMRALFERQLAHVEWIRGMGDMEQAELLPHAQNTFELTLARVDARIIAKFNHPEPYTVILDYVEPFGEFYDNALSSKTRGAAPLIIVRRAFPLMLATSQPRSLAGVALPSSGARGGGGGAGGGGGGGGGRGDGGGGGGGDGGRGKGGGKGKGKGDGKAVQPGKPGSKSGLAQWTDDTHMRLGPQVYDTAAIASYYGLGEGMCFPVLLTVKTGGEALCLCADWGTDGHTSLTSAKHKRPATWNANYIDKHFAAAAGDGKKSGRKPGAKDKTSAK